MINGKSGTIIWDEMTLREVSDKDFLNMLFGSQFLEKYMINNMSGSK